MLPKHLIVFLFLVFNVLINWLMLTCQAFAPPVAVAAATYTSIINQIRQDSRPSWHVGPHWPSCLWGPPSPPLRACLQRLHLPRPSTVCGHFQSPLHYSKGCHSSTSFIEGPNKPKRVGRGDVVTNKVNKTQYENTATAHLLFCLKRWHSDFCRWYGPKSKLFFVSGGWWQSLSRSRLW